MRGAAGHLPVSRGMAFLRGYIWNDGRVLGFDAVEWLTWLAALSVVALMTLAI